MKLIKHGTEFNPHRVTCKTCECVYEWETEDVLSRVIGNASLHNSQMEEYAWVICPECGSLNYLRGGKQE